MLTINNTLDGYLKDVEIKGNTIQDIENLADIRSVGEKVEGQELYEIPVLSVGKNLFDQSAIMKGYFWSSTNTFNPYEKSYLSEKYIKVRPNTKLTTNITTGSVQLMEYDKDKNFIQRINVYLGTVYTVPSGVHYLRVSVYDNELDFKFQLEEGTVATPYEPYQEDKITILSPTPLEKVGDVADRIIEKDGVWGVEKNVETYKFDKVPTTYGFIYNLNWTQGNTCGFYTYYFRDNYPIIKQGNGYAICDKLPRSNKNLNTIDEVCVGTGSQYIAFRVPFSEMTSLDKAGAEEWIAKNTPTVKYVLATPQFIPLPHDQQVKLRTFANKTNISFLTEIEGTIKAQVPKSLGATVNTHTEQISNLNKELDRVKKLEESTVSTVETESDFTTVEATSNGYFEDVKLEGKTLVNLCPLALEHTVGNDTVAYSRRKTFDKQLDLNKEYTLAILNAPTSKIRTIASKGYLFNETAYKSIIKFKPLKNDSFTIYFYGTGFTDSDFANTKYVLLEGDHTQNPPSYFEGLKSVGDGADEIVVSSVNENLFDKNNCSYNINDGGYYISNYININDKLYYDIYKNLNATKYVYYEFLDKNKKKIYINYNVSHPQSGIIENTCGAKYIRLQMRHNTTITKEEIDNNYGVIISSSPIKNINTPRQSDKKRLLYYNEETQTWEKPVLREWDSIEKHSDGKYYYHQRSGEVVLNGSENWVLDSVVTSETTIRFRMSNPIYMKSNSEIISDKFRFRGVQSHGEYEYIWNNDVALYINSLQSKLPTQDVQGFKQWLQTNNVTVVCKLAEEKVYECTNIDLITYANETNYIVESGAIAPKSTLKVHNNISNVVSLLQKKVSLLESNITNYMITQNRMQLASTYSADSVTFKVDYFSLCGDEENYDEDLYNLILNNILVGKDNYNYDKMFTMILDYASWNQISWEQFDILVGLMDIQHNPPVEEEITEDEIVEEIPNEIM